MEVPLEALVAACPQTLYACDLAGEVRFLSPAVERLTGHPPEALAGTRLWSLLEEADRTRLAAARAAVRAPGEGYRLEYALRARDGGLRLVADEARARSGAEGLELVGVLADRGAAGEEAELRAGEAAVQLLAQVAASVAHEVNNYLGGVLNYAQLVHRLPPGDPRAAPALEGIVSEGRRIQTAMQTLAAYGRTSLTPAPLGLAELAQAGLTPLRRRLREDGVTVELELDGHLPPVASRGQDLCWALRLLLEEARRGLVARCPGRGPERRLRLSGALEEDPAGGPERVALRLEDQGTAGDGPGPVPLEAPLARRLVERGGGGLELSQGPNGGLVALLRLPLF